MTCNMTKADDSTRLALLSGGAGMVVGTRIINATIILIPRPANEWLRVSEPGFLRFPVGFQGHPWTKLGAMPSGLSRAEGSTVLRGQLGYLEGRKQSW